ncbi:MAG: ATP-dependent sacrificial sulfur transferase LarE, partial [SAR324 cluster bacterium]|nr:ATP-dependent sacrificial sulfur transferase LarE [SAR324 cluster bacterium]
MEQISATTPDLSPDLEAKFQALERTLEELGSAVVAFSGGIDSSLVAYLAHQRLGKKALAVTSSSESLNRDDLDLTRRLTAQWGMAHRVVKTNELENPNYRANPINRCYFCKTTLYESLDAVAAEGGYETVLNGTNVDDLGDHRPGLQAAREHGVRSPLVECGFTKADIRALARRLGLENAEKPQAACLSSRVPY